MRLQRERGNSPDITGTFRLPVDPPVLVGPGLYLKRHLSFIPSGCSGSAARVSVRDPLVHARRLVVYPVRNYSRSGEDSKGIGRTYTA